MHVWGLTVCWGLNALTENMSLVPSALFAVNLGAHRNDIVPLVARLELYTIELVVEAGPSGSAVELGLGGVGRRSTPGTRGLLGRGNMERGNVNNKRARGHTGSISGK